MEDRAAESVDKWNRKKYTKYLEEEKVAQKGDLLSFRPDIKVLDATIRDGGLVNDFILQMNLSIICTKQM